jgi:acyl-CoA dehydrogenase
VDFALSDEQQMIAEVTRGFVDAELAPHEDEVERTGCVRAELAEHIRCRALDAGLYAANMPAELGGGGLGTLDVAVMERQLGRTSMALQYIVARPSNILRACVGEQVDRWLLPTVRGERVECLAMSEPDAGSDLRGMRCRAVREGDDYVVTGTKHFISHADVADYVILFAATGDQHDDERGRRSRITAFLVDHDTPGFEVADGYALLRFDGCRVPAANVLGEEHRGFEVATTWLGSTRLQVAATCLGRADRAIEIATRWAADRRQFGRQIGRFQGVSFKLADMITEIDAADWLTLAAAWRLDQGLDANREIASAKVFASEMLSRVTDEAIQIHGGMGLMDDLPLARFWRDARVERIWDGTSEIQRHIISRDILRPLES